eukprot:CAMPEP_0178768748 /NCGR_PEP_ID=MMETSP0744-20121128/20418_1 /TAXON_ID=913974 /ORGANISM="Nitzschia punctata, Strain CCMP561" /LENGTH=47 /DNA_ID= /DNA_START= /DNA_END= /DNA_ORIENTATION=
MASVPFLIVFLFLKITFETAFVVLPQARSRTRIPQGASSWFAMIVVI